MMTLGSRATSIGRRARTWGMLAGLLVLQACSVDLYTNLDQRQANEIVAALMRDGIPAERELTSDGLVIVRVDEDRFAQAMAVLEQAGLPREKFQTLGDVFKRDGLVSSPLEERAAMIFGLSQELSQTITDIDGVLSARVHVVLPENDPLRQNLIPSSASVFIRHRDDIPMNERVPQVKMLVANGIAGLTYENVSVTLVPVPAPAPSVAQEQTELTNVMGLWMHSDSVSTALLIIASLGGVIVLLGGAVAYLGLNRRPQVYALARPTEEPMATLDPKRGAAVAS